MDHINKAITIVGNAFTARKIIKDYQLSSVYLFAYLDT